MICLLVRALACARRDHRQPPTGWVRRHLDCCPACREEQAGLRWVDQSLRRTAALAWVEPPPGLDGRLASRVRARVRGRVAEPVMSWPVLLGRLLAVVAGVLVIGGVLVWRENPEATAPPAAGVVEGDSQESPWVVLDPSRLLVASQRLDEPLEREFEFLVADARGAAQSLLVAFLPVREW